jgi:hypothetical protein
LHGLLRVSARGWECALRLLALEGRAPGFRIEFRLGERRAHVIEAGAQLGDEFVNVR